MTMPSLAHTQYKGVQRCQRGHCKGAPLPNSSCLSQAQLLHVAPTILWEDVVVGLRLSHVDVHKHAGSLHRGRAWRLPWHLQYVPDHSQLLTDLLLNTPFGDF